jgi:hypothetical protein
MTPGKKCMTRFEKALRNSFVAAIILTALCSMKAFAQTSGAVIMTLRCSKVNGDIHVAKT